MNGRGLLLTTEACLLNPNRNPRLTRTEIERRLMGTLGVYEVIWLGGASRGTTRTGTSTT